MSWDEFIVTLASAAAVLFLIFIAWALGFRDAARIAGEAEARRAIEAQEAGASVQHTLVGKDARTALARLDDGRLATICAMGDSLAIRAFPATAARIMRKRFGLRVAFADLGHPRIDVRFDGAPPVWVQPLFRDS